MTDLIISDISLHARLEGMERLLLSAIREGLVQSRPGQGGWLVRSDDGPELFVPVGREYRMARFDLAGEPRLGGPSGPVVEDLESLFDLLHGRIDGSVRQRLLGELGNSLSNTEDSLRALSQLGPGEPGVGGLADWEGRVWLGHPLHPGSRLRSGVRLEENQRFAAEWQPLIKLPLLELPSQDVVVEGEFWAEMEALFPGRFVGERGKVRVPVHPWAAERDLPARFAAEFASGRWSFVSGSGLLARPSMSFRSVLLEGCDAHLKLPVAVQTTGATRTVSVAAAYNGPLMSRFLEQLWSRLEGDGALRGLSLMAEPASFRLANDAQGQSRFLAGILRRGVGPAIDGQRWLLPAAALLEPRENPLFLRAAAYYGCTSLQLWAAYVSALLPPLCLLGGRLGIALEAHPQNLVVECLGPPGALPEVRFHYRDLGGIRLHPGRLAEGLSHFGLGSRLEAPRVWPGSATCTDSLRDLASKLIYSVLQNHLGELCRAVVRCSDEDEQAYWQVVRDVLRRSRPEMGEELAGRVFANHWDLKAMWRMRLESAITEYSYASVANPLGTVDE